MSNNGSNRGKSGSGSKRPTHDAWTVREIGPDKSFWDRVGVGWANADGKGINVELFAFPVNGKLTIRDRKDDDDPGRDPQEGDR